MLKKSENLSTNKNTCSKMAKSWLYILLALVIGVFCGWLIGRQREVDIKETVRYIEGPTTTVYVDKPVPIKSAPIEIPIYIHDTLRIQEEVVVRPDTLAIVADYLQRREYKLDFSTDTTGVFKVDAVVEANHLTSATAQIIPIYREVEKIVEVQQNKFRPYIGGAIGVGKQIGASVEIGAQIRNHHLPKLGYQRLGEENYFTIGYGYVF